LGAAVAGLQVLGDGERLTEEKGAEQIWLELEPSSFAGPAGWIVYHRGHLSFTIAFTKRFRLQLSTRDLVPAL
jgi:hypothetical protein